MKRILFAAAFGSILLTSVSIHAKPQSEHAIAPMFKQLNLSSSQRQEIRSIMQQLREDNSLYAADKAEIKLQMDTLFALDTWDEALASDIVTQKILSSSQASLNAAIAKHQAYQVLTAEQQAELNGNSQSRDKQKIALKKFSKLSRRLNLSAAQETEFESLMEAQAVAFSTFDSEINDHKEAERAIIRADEFDQDAWNALNSDYVSTQGAIQLIKLETRFNFRQLLSEEQLEKLSKIEDRKKRGRGKA